MKKQIFLHNINFCKLEKCLLYLDLMDFNKKRIIQRAIIENLYTLYIYKSQKSKLNLL